MSKKIFFTDLDGTLLNDKKEITPATYDAVINWMNNGNYLVLSSGRPLDSILEVADKNKLLHENLFTIGFNGALIYQPSNKTKHTAKTLSQSQIEEIVKTANQHGIYCHAYDDASILVPYESDELMFYKRTVHFPHIISENFPEGINESYKILCIELNDTKKLDSLASDLSKSIEGITCVKSNDKLLEVFNSTAGKGSAVTELCSILNIDIKDSFAAGDEQNDISMLTTAGTGIAMLNGRDIVRKSADIITKTDNNNDGLVPFLLN